MPLVLGNAIPTWDHPPPASSGSTETKPSATTPSVTTPSASGGDKGHTDSGGQSNAKISLSSSVRDFVFENNSLPHQDHRTERWFGKETDRFARGSAEQERENMRHCMLLHLRGGRNLYLPPLRDLQLILDIGTGTGSWSIDMAERYPDATVIGHDLSTPIQPSKVPSNVRFVTANVDGPWDVDPNAYDFVNIRNMARVINNWPLVMSEAYRALKPGGWIQIQDIDWHFYAGDNTFDPGGALGQFTKAVREGWFILGGYSHFFDEGPERLAAAGFEKIKNPCDSLPIGPWLRGHDIQTVGLYSRSILYDSLEDIATAPLVQGLKWSPASVESFLAEVRKDLMDTGIHSYVGVWTLFGRKPE